MNIVTPLTYSVANVSKRIVIISFSILVLQNQVTFVNFLGILTSVVGVGIYNKVKYDEKKAKELPKTVKDSRSTTYNLWNNNQYPTSKVMVAPPAGPAFPRANGGFNNFNNGVNNPNQSYSSYRPPANTDGFNNSNYSNGSTKYV